MLAPNNFLSPATGEPILTPSQDMVLGCFYLTANNPAQQSFRSHYFANFEDVMMAYQQGVIPLHAFVWVRVTGYFTKARLGDNATWAGDIEYSVSPYSVIKKSEKGEILSEYIRTTAGRILLHESFK